LRLLLDTHALLWWLSDDALLPQTAREIISDKGNMLLASAASAWELAIKFQLGKLRKAGDVITDFSARMEVEGIQVLSISAEDAIRAGLLPGSHKDPFDRMLIAQCQAENVPIISNDPVFDRYGVRRLW
jgi:PIN domain nuclease of toxin-antitoxin system